MSNNGDKSDKLTLDCPADAARRCRGCEKESLASDFPSKRAICRDCLTLENKRKYRVNRTRILAANRAYRQSERGKQTQARYQEKRRARPDKTARNTKHRLKYRYGITLEDYQRMVLAQKGCAVCGVTSSRLVIDHCHASGKVRGLLCNRCNYGIGVFKDSAVQLENAAMYLRVELILGDRQPLPSSNGCVLYRNSHQNFGSGNSAWSYYE